MRKLSDFLTKDEVKRLCNRTLNGIDSETVVCDLLFDHFDDLTATEFLMLCQLNEMTNIKHRLNEIIGLLDVTPKADVHTEVAKQMQSIVSVEEILHAVNQ